MNLLSKKCNRLFNIKSNSLIINNFDLDKLNFSNCYISTFCLNICSFNNKIDILTIFLKQLEGKFEIIAFVETRKINTQLLNNLLTSYELFYVNPKLNKCGGIIVWIKNNYTITQREDLEIKNNQVDNIWLELNDIVCKQKYIISIIYRHPNLLKGSIKLFKNNIKQSINLVDNNLYKTIILGDINIDLFNQKENLNVKYIDFLIQNNLSPINLNNITRHNRNSNAAITGTCIDHIYFMKNIKNKTTTCINYGTIETSISDHLATYLQLIKTESSILPTTNALQKTDKIIKIYNTKQNSMFLPNFLNLLKNKNLNSNYNIFNLIEECHNITYNINKAYNNSHKGDNSWITEELKYMIKIKIKLYKKYHKTKNINDNNIYKKYKNKLNMLIKNTKLSYYTKQLNIAKNNPKKVWTIINQLLGKDKKYLYINNLESENDIINKPEDIANVLNITFNKLGTTVNISQPYISQYNNLNINQCKFQFQNISNENLILNFNKLKKFNSGFDGIRPNEIKLIFNNALSFINMELNNSLKNGIYPEQFKLIKIVPLFKNGKKNNPINYRPINNMPIFSKLLDNIVNNQLLSYLDTNNMIKHSQYGFRKNHSCILQLLKLKDIIYNNLSSNNLILVVFIDLKQAFPSVKFDLLIQDLHNLGINDVELNWFKSYMTNMSHYTCINNHLSKKLTYQNGVFQGSVLATTLFNIYINNLSEIDEANILLYADDIALIVTDKNINELVNKTNDKLHKIHNWFQNKQLYINYSKTKYMLFKGKKKLDQDKIRIKIDNSTIENTNQYKYLGVYFDNNMNWKYHFNYIIKKIRAFIPTFYRLRYILPEKHLINILKVNIIPIVNYAIEIYGTEKYTNQIDIYIKKLINIMTFKTCNSHQELINFYTNNYILHSKDTLICKLASLLHFMINNDYQLPIYFRNKIKLCRNRRGLLLVTNYRKNSYGDQILINKMHDIWNNLPMDIRNIQEYYCFKNELINYLIKERNN